VDWDNASELQPALTGAISGTQIWAARGIYRPGPGGDRAATFQLKNGVALYGGFAGNELLLDQRDLAANPTILSGDLLANDGAAGANFADNSYHVVTGSGVNASALLDGFIVEGGSATPVHCAGASGCVDDPLAIVGGGMLNDHGSPTLHAVTFRANNAEFTGGALYNATSSPILDHVTFTNNRAGAGGAIYNVFSAPLITDVVFENNAATDEGAPAGAIFNASSNPIISNSRFEHNIALSSGGAIYNDTSSPVIIGSVFVGNQALGQGSSGGGGGAIDYYSDSAPLIVRSTFTANTAPRGGAIRGQNSAGRILFSTFFGNRALEGDSSQPGGGMGGAISIDYGSLRLSHVLLSGNQAVNGAGGVMAENAALDLDNMTIVENRAASGGALALPQSTAWITNSIVWGNSGPALSATAGLSVSHSLVQGGYPGGDAILDADPLFLDFDGLDGTVGTADDDLRLRGDSPAVDAGDTAALPADTIDDDGDGDRAEPAPRDLAGNRRVRGAAIDLGAYEVTSAISNTAPPLGMYGSSYSYQLVADTDKPMAYELVQGTPPIGTTLNSATGLISGTPLWVGTYSFVLRYGPAFRNVSITIAPAPLLITANNLQRAPGAANPALTVTYSGFVLDDDAADLLGAPTCTTTATIASSPGTYPITCTAGSIANPNYALSFAAGTLTVGAYPYRLALPQITR
jgi:hypothetical protein